MIPDMPIPVGEVIDYLDWATLVSSSAGNMHASLHMPIPVGETIDYLDWATLVSSRRNH